MSDDKLFDFIVARSKTRETSTLTIATIAASASLILLALYFQPVIQTNENYSNLIRIMGILFPVIGIAYNEVTSRTIQDADQIWIRNKILNETPKESKNDVEKT
ncbi:MAG TPA: hypothetical protein VLC72_00570 [Nitrosopumilaceae archaeon]|nr:hypothetical protein [Nitrosopumilaceae archaeon]